MSASRDRRDRRVLSREEPEDWVPDEDELASAAIYLAFARPPEALPHGLRGRVEERVRALMESPPRREP